MSPFLTYTSKSKTNPPYNFNKQTALILSKHNTNMEIQQSDIH